MTILKTFLPSFIKGEINNTMKALSLRQPYAELIVSGRKTIELRKWNTKHRGTFLVHASKYKPSTSELSDFNLKIEDIQFGALLGTVELVDVKNYDDYEDEEWLKDTLKHLAGVDYRFSTKGFLLKNPIRFKNPIPYKGQLQFFNVDTKLINGDTY